MKTKLTELCNHVKIVLEEKDYTAREAVMGGTILLLLGIIIGAVLTPKKHTMIGSNNGNNNTGSFTPIDEWDGDEE